MSSTTIAIGDGRYWEFNNMETDNDCGPVAIATATGVARQDVLSKWPGNFLGNQSDSFIHHQEALKRLGFKWTTISKKDFLDGKFTPGNTVVMVNSLDDPKTLLPENAFMLHWCVPCAIKNAPGYVRADKEFFIWAGNGRIWSFSRREMEKRMENPFCVAYSVEKVEVVKELPWYKKLYTRVTSWWK